MVDFRRGNSFSHGLQATFGLIGWYLVIGLIGVGIATASIELAGLWYLISAPLILARIFKQVDKMVAERLEAYHREVHGEELAAIESADSEEDTDPWFQGDNGFKHKVVGDRSRGKLVEVSDGDESAKFFLRDGDVTPESKRVESVHDDEWLNGAENHIHRYLGD